MSSSFSPHCNLCCQSEIDAKSKLTSCGHFICKNCSSAMDIIHTCPVCNESCTTILCSGNVPQEVQSLVTLNASETLDQVKKTVEFQISHYQAVIAQQNENQQEMYHKLEKTQQIYDELQKIKTENEKFQNQITTMHKENSELKKEISELQNQLKKNRNSVSRPMTPSKERFSMLTTKPSFLKNNSRIQKPNSIFNQKDSLSPQIGRNIFDKVLSPNSRSILTTPTTSSNQRNSSKEIRRETFSPSNNLGPGNTRQGKFLSPKSPDLFKLKKKK
eukprot:gene7106-11269_t